MGTAPIEEWDIYGRPVITKLEQVQPGDVLQGANGHVIVLDAGGGVHTTGPVKHSLAEILGNMRRMTLLARTETWARDKYPDDVDFTTDDGRDLVRAQYAPPPAPITQEALDEVLASIQRDAPSNTA